MLFAKFSIFLSLFILFAVFQEPALAIKKSYIVYLGGHSHGPEITTVDLQRVSDSHTQLLASFLGSKEKAKDAIFYSYDRHINGFAAVLEEEEAAEIAKHPDVVSVFLSQGRKLHTTHSWDFLMLERNGVIHPSSIWKKARFGEDVIIANIDTGVWPESKSFSPEGYGSIPSKWKGTCDFDDKESPCNRKLIGARYFNKGFFQGYPITKHNSSYHSTRDTEGHGSHTLSTAAGNFVPGANVLGEAIGTAKGGSPRARVATYKACWPADQGGCFDSDIMKGIDHAIHDGVDVLSMSLGGENTDYFNDAIAIGAFHAVRKGIVVVASAGNDGPTAGTVANIAPWIITVGSSTLDRLYQSDVHLKNGLVLEGQSLSKPLPSHKFYPLISAADVGAANVSVADAILCKANTLDLNKAKGKIVVCLRGQNARVEKGMEAARAGAAGMILCNDVTTGNDIVSDPHVLPATQLKYTDGLVVFAYLNSSSNPQGLMTPSKEVHNVKPAPTMSGFSSRGPNNITPEILKPDITAPGSNIIAAFSQVASPTDIAIDKRVTAYNVMSGTSMSCPHVSGLVGLLKTLHPDWSPAAIKSAIMTSARTRDNTVNPMEDVDYSEATPFDYGSGNIRPNRAMDPGLVYDLTINDYLDFLCGLGYNQTQISQFSSLNYNCPQGYSILNLNYPSLSVPNLYGSVEITRKLKNVGKPGTYASRIRQPPGYSVTVEPKLLHFKQVGQELTFKLTIKAIRASSTYKFGQLIWSDDTHYVRSPIVVASAR